MEDIVAQQNIDAVARMPTGFRGSALPPPHGMAQAATSAKPASSNVGSVAFGDPRRGGHPFDDGNLITRSSRSAVPYNEQIMAQHLFHALLQDRESGADPKAVDAGIRRILGVIGRPNDSTSTFSTHDALECTRQEIPTRKPFRLDSLPSAHARIDRHEPETEASKFGVALQFGEVVKPRDLANAGVAQYSSSLGGAHGLSETSTAGRNVVGSELSLPRSEELKQRARPDGFSCCNNLFHGEQGKDAANTAADTANTAADTANTTAIDDLPDPSVADSSETETEESDDGGIFSDADEDLA